MYVIVIGMGQVGRHVVRTLAAERHEVVAVDSDPVAIRYIEEHHDVMTLEGYGASARILEEARVSEADMVVAVTDNDEVNLIASLAARQMGAKKAVARVQSNAWSGDIEETEGVTYGLLGVDVVFNPRVLLAQELAKIAQSHGAIDVIDLANDRIEVVQMEIGENTRVLHKTLAKMPLPRGVLVGAVVRDGELFIPGGADVLLTGDRIYLMGLPSKMVAAEDLFSHRKEAHEVCIVGGGVIGESLARQLVPTGAKIRLIEMNEKKAQRLAKGLKSVTVIHGDGTDVELLEEELIEQCDLFVGVTHEDEVNLMACLLASRLGAERTAALVHRPDYIEIYRQLGLDVVLSPRAVASDHILRYARRTRLQSLAVLEDGQAEILEILTPEKARVVNVPVRRVSFPRGSLLVAILKDDGVVVPGGNDVIHAGDTVVMLTTPSARSAVNRLFKERAL